MVLELADIRIHPGQQAKFDLLIQEGVERFILPSKGFLTFKVHKGIETPERYLLTITWDTLEDHSNFRASPSFTEWRHLITPFLATAPAVEHFTLIAESKNGLPI